MIVQREPAVVSTTIKFGLQLQELPCLEVWVRQLPCTPMTTSLEMRLLLLQVNMTFQPLAQQEYQTIQYHLSKLILDSHFTFTNTVGLVGGTLYSLLAITISTQ